MKTKLLKLFSLRATMLTAMLCAAFTGAWADDVYEKFTGSIEEGEYIIADGTTAMKAAISSDRLAYSTIVIVDDCITNPSVDLVWTVTANGDYYTIYNANTLQYAASTGAKNKAALESSVTDKSKWSISGNSTYEFVNKQNATNNVNKNLRYNNGFGFACYSTSTGEALTLYKKVADDPRTAVNITSFSATSPSLKKGENTTTTITNDQSGWEAAYTYETSNDAVATISDGVITATGKGTATITANLNVAADDPTYKAGTVKSKTITITVTNPNPATFIVNGNVVQSSEVEQGETITFPTNPSAIDSKEFQGWTTSTINGTSSTAPSILVTSASMGESSVTYYAVFATKSSSFQDATLTIDVNTKNVPGSYGTANAFTEYTLEGVKFQIQQMYKNGTKLQWRAAGNSSGTGTIYNSDALTSLQSVVLTYDSGDSNKNFTLKVGSSSNPTSGTSITPTSSGNVYTFDCSEENANYFVLTNGTGAGYLTSVVINYKEEITSYSNYCTIISESVHVTSAGFATFCSDKALDFTGTGITAYAGEISGTTLTFSPVENNQVPANTGVLLVTDGETTQTVPVIADLAAISSCLTGVLTETTINSDDYILNMKDGKPGFYPAGTYTTLGANKAYITKETAGLVKGFAINFDGDETVVKAVKVLNGNAAIYNLAGQRMNKAQKGVFIQNGKKFIVK